MVYQNIDPKLLPFLVAISIWELVWKGLALWKSARNGSKIWYFSILVFNTAGILPIIYLVREYFTHKNQPQA